MSADRELQLRARISRRPQRVRSGETLEWSVRLDNPGSQTLHVATDIQQIDAAPDGRTLTVSTERATFDPAVVFALFRLDTTPIQPGEKLEQAFSLALPLRLVRLTGFPPRAETDLWMPAPAFTLVTHVAFSDRPFQRPADPARLDEALRAWTHVIRAPAMRLKAGPDTEQSEE